MATIYEEVETLKTQMEQVLAAQEDSGWIALNMLNGALSYSTDQAPQYRKIGKEIFIRGVIKNVTTFPTVVAQLPEGYRPSHKIIFDGISNGVDSIRFELGTNGELNLAHNGDKTVSGNHHYSIGLIVYLVD